MNERTKFIGAWVSKDEKDEIVKTAKAQNLSVSGLIRSCIIRPMMTLPDVAKSVKIHIDNKFHNLENELKKQLFNREPIRRTIIEEYAKPIERLRPPPRKIIEMTPQRPVGTKELMIQLKDVLTGKEEYKFEKVSEEELSRKREKTDHLSFIQFKEKAMKREPLFQKN